MGDVTPDRDTTVLGPEVFASTDEAVICWRGENYVKQAEVERLRALVREARAMVPHADEPSTRRAAWCAAADEALNG